MNGPAARLLRTAGFSKSVRSLLASASDNSRTIFTGWDLRRAACGTTVTVGACTVVHSSKASLLPTRPVIFLRRKTGYRNKAGSKSAAEADESEDDDEPSAGEDEETSPDGARYAVPGWPASYKLVKHHLGTLRADAVLAAGLNVSRRKIEEEFLNSKLAVNGEKLLKKSLQLKTGDYVDLVVEQLAEGNMKVKRVKVVQVGEKQTASGRITVILQAWRVAFDTVAGT